MIDRESTAAPISYRRLIKWKLKKDEVGEATEGYSPVEETSET